MTKCVFRIIFYGSYTSGFYRLAHSIACVDVKPQAPGIKALRDRMASIKRIGTLFVISTLMSVLPSFADNVEQARELNRQAADLMGDGQLTAAAQKYRQAIHLNPQSAGYHSNLALVLKDLNELGAAEQEARLAVKLNGKKPSYRYNLGVILQKKANSQRRRHVWLRS